MGIVCSHGLSARAGSGDLVSLGAELLDYRFLDGLSGSPGVEAGHGIGACHDREKRLRWNTNQVRGQRDRVRRAAFSINTTRCLFPSSDGRARTRQSKLQLLELGWGVAGCALSWDNRRKGLQFDRGGSEAGIFHCRSFFVLGLHSAPTKKGGSRLLHKVRVRSPRYAGRCPECGLIPGKAK